MKKWLNQELGLNESLWEFALYVSVFFIDVSSSACNRFRLYTWKQVSGVEKKTHHSKPEVWIQAYICFAAPLCMRAHDLHTVVNVCS